MVKKQGNTKERLKNLLRKQVISFLKENPTKKTISYKEICNTLKVKGSDKRELIYNILKELSKDEFIKEIERGVFSFTKKNDSYFIGTLDMTKNGSGYLITNELKEDVFISKKHLSRAMNGDTVKVQIIKPNSQKINGKVIEIIKRKKEIFAGTIEKNKKFAFFIPDDTKINVDFFIPFSKLKGANNGHKVLAKISDWPLDSKSPFAEVVEILGTPYSNDAEMYSILAEQGINWSFPDNVIQEASKLTQNIEKEELLKRRDFRKTPTFTIDPNDAKDFDDALSVKFLANGITELGVHIADVGHYVQPNSILDQEAKKRGNSVYLVDRVIPMLPENISNILCSLRPNEEKYSFSIVFKIDSNGKIIDEWYGKGIICSDRRFTYKEAQEIIEEQNGDFKNEIIYLDKLAKNYREKRLKNGALNFNSNEIRFILNEKGQPTEVVKKTAKDSNQLIEEFMLLANRKIAKFIGKKKNASNIPFPYRVHDKPNIEKLKTFNLYLNKFNIKGKFDNPNKISKELNKIFMKLKNENEFDAIQSMAIRTMAKASYDTINIGHYGLGFNNYTHFTSPIRRYADLLVHRIVFDELNKQKTKYSEDLRETCKYISKTERQAIEAERNSVKYFQALFVRNDIGKEFEGKISGITNWGMYVEMYENQCEGMVAIKDIPGDNFVFDEEKFLIKGLRYGQTFQIGDNVSVLIKKVNLRKRQIDLGLLN